MRGRIGRALDAQDREFVGRVLIGTTGISLAILLAAAVSGLAVRVFSLAAG